MNLLLRFGIILFVLAIFFHNYAHIRFVYALKELQDPDGSMWPWLLPNRLYGRARLNYSQRMAWIFRSNADPVVERRRQILVRAYGFDLLSFLLVLAGALTS